MLTVSINAETNMHIRVENPRRGSRLFKPLAKTKDEFCSELVHEATSHTNEYDHNKPESLKGSTTHSFSTEKR
jgi:hypothetical protein